MTRPRGGGVALDIVIPVHNEAGNITAVIQSLRCHVRTPFRVLICYDRPDDTTLATLRRFPLRGLRLKLVRNEGKGPQGAVLSGFRASRAPAVLALPADDTFNAPIIDRAYTRFQRGSEIVVLSRFMEGGRMEGCPWLKAVLVRTASFLLFHAGRFPVHDATSGTRLFSRRVLTSIPVESRSGFTYSIELSAKCHRLGWRIEEVPAFWFERRRGKSRFRILKWLPGYLRWFAYVFATTWLRRGPDSVPLREVRGAWTSRLK